MRKHQRGPQRRIGIVSGHAHPRIRVPNGLSRSWAKVEMKARQDVTCQALKRVWTSSSLSGKTSRQPMIH